MPRTQAAMAPGAFADVAALRECWHPVAFGHDLGDRPVHADLLGEPLVLWRGPGGQPGPARQHGRPAGPHRAAAAGSRSRLGSWSGAVAVGCRDMR